MTRATCPYIDNKSSGCKMSTHQMDVCNKQIYACTNKVDICNNKWIHAKTKWIYATKKWIDEQNDYIVTLQS